MNEWSCVWWEIKTTITQNFYFTNQTFLHLANLNFNFFFFIASNKRSIPKFFFKPQLIISLLVGWNVKLPQTWVIKPSTKSQIYTLKHSIHNEKMFSLQKKFHINTYNMYVRIYTYTYTHNTNHCYRPLSPPSFSLTNPHTRCCRLEKLWEHGFFD